MLFGLGTTPTLVGHRLVDRTLGDWDTLGLVVATCLEAEAVANLPGTLFTGGLLANPQSVQPWASDADWVETAEHACRHLPCREALRWTLGRIRALPQAVTVALPLLGPGIPTERVNPFFDQLEALPVGADLLPSTTEHSEESVAVVT